MEHLPQPKHGVCNEYGAVPYVCRKDYDGGEILTYPTRVGVHHALPLDGNVPGGSPYIDHERIHPTPKHEMEAFFQTWLFFGLIEEILGRYCTSADLVHWINTPEGPTKALSTLKVAKTLPQWFADIQAETTNPRPTYEHVSECLRLVFATLMAAGPDFDPRIKLSLASLGELFAYYANRAYQIYSPNGYNKCPNSWASLTDRWYWEEQMQNSGMCPSNVNMILESALSLQTLYFFTCLGEPQSDNNHWSCGSQRCLAYQNTFADYQTRHINRECGCQQLTIDTKILLDILRKGQLPLVRIIEGDTLAELSVEVEPSKPALPYVAFNRDRDYPGVDLTSIEEGLQYRSVSVPSDEPVLIANLLGLDVAAIVNNPDSSHSARMQLLWKMMPCATRGIPKEIIFRICPRLNMEGFKWAPNTMLNIQSANVLLDTKRKGDNRGIPSPDGLVVTLVGYTVSLAPRPRAVPASLRRLMGSGDENWLWLREGAGTWFALSRRLPEPQPDFLSDKNLRTTMLEEPYLWLIHMPVEFTHTVVRGNGAQSVTVGLLVNLVKHHEEINYVQSKLHIRLGIVTRYSQVLLEAAYQSAQEVSKSIPAQRLAAKTGSEVDMNLPEYKADFEALRAEIHQAASRVDESLITLASSRSQNGLGHVRDMIGKMFLGSYGLLGERTADSQRWCVD